MKNIHTLTLNRYRFALLSVACLLFILPGCRNPLQQRDTTGIISLTFSHDLGRTIMPPTGLAKFDKFEIVFTRGNTEIRHVWTYDQLAVGTIELVTGNWFLAVSA